MIKPAEIVDALVDKLRAIPELVAELGAAENIVPYHSRYPTEVNLFQFIHKQKAGSLVVAHRGTGFSGRSEWQHRIEVYLRSGENVPDDPVRSYSTLMQLMMDGIPSGQPVSLLQGDIHTSNGVATSDLVSVNFDYPIDEEGREYQRCTLSFEERLGI